MHKLSQCIVCLDELSPDAIAGVTDLGDAVCEKCASSEDRINISVAQTIVDAIISEALMGGFNEFDEEG